MEPLNDLDIQLLSDFENGSLSKEQLKIIENRLKTDIAFKQLHNDLKTIGSLLKEHYSGITNVKVSPTRSYLKKLEDSLPEIREENPVDKDYINQSETTPVEKGKIISLFRKNYLVLAAASIALLIVTGMFLKYKNTDTNLPLLSEELLKPYPNVVNPQKMGDEVNSDEISSAYRTYESKDYANAAKQFEKILIKKEDPYILFYTGSAYYATNENDKAIEKFRFLLEKYKGFGLEDQARWYKSLCAFNLGDLKKAEEELSKLKSNYYKEQAAKLLLRFKK